MQVAIKQKEVDEQITLDDVQITSVLNKMVKQRRDSIEQFEAGNRPDLSEIEANEITVLEKYLPAPLSETEVDQAIAEAMVSTEASGMTIWARSWAT